MTTNLTIRNGVINRHDRVNHAAGDKVRRHNRDLVALGKKRDGNDPFNEAFSFTNEEFEILKKLHPELADADPQRRFKAWQAFAQSSAGKAMRVR